MNLIEQLGGYEKAKDHRDYLFDFGNEFNRPNKYEVNKINNALLEYRRQHNIFEVKDKVVVKAEPFWPEDYLIQTVGQEHIGKWYMSAWRHATDEEIKAGKRLEVNQ